jgi:hypothetical protein
MTTLTGLSSNNCAGIWNGSRAKWRPAALIASSFFTVERAYHSEALTDAPSTEGDGVTIAAVS